ncbi:methyltransferase domain-containing protein [Streptomyces sp. NPDC048629]|uniref:SAM-dependent methyltransferase n=1 Tax=Streptomyces sp. NPDC048629 TaxID=3154824 RepID=UPI00342164EE
MATSQKSPLVRSSFEEAAFTYYDTKRNDALNLDLGHSDGFYHHHFAVGDFDHSVLDLTGDARQQAINHEIHKMETRQVDSFTELLTPLTPGARVLDAGSGRGGTAFLLHEALSCQVDGVNFSSYQNDFARTEATRRGVGEAVRFHERNMTSTGFARQTFDAVISNETTMYVDLREAFTEFARVLKPGGRYLLLTWCVNDTLDPAPLEATAIDEHYRCRTHARSAYLTALLDAGLVPYQVDDLTDPATPYWELRAQSELATGIEKSYLDGYRANTVNYMRIAARKPRL